MKKALLVILNAKPGKEKELEAFLASAKPLVDAEPLTETWFAFKAGPSSFGIYDTFAAEEGRAAHLAGKVAAALLAKAPELLAGSPDIQKVEILAEKR